jgi:hypothetical protein
VKLSGVGQFLGRTSSQKERQKQREKNTLTGKKNKNILDTHRPSHGRSYVGILPISTILTMCSAISIATCFTFFPGNEFGFLHDAFEKFVVKDWKGLSLDRAARPIHRIPARRFYMNPKQEIELVLRVLSTQVKVSLRAELDTRGWPA